MPLVRELEYFYDGRLIERSTVSSTVVYSIFLSPASGVAFALPAVTFFLRGIVHDLWLSTVENYSLLLRFCEVERGIIAAGRGVRGSGRRICWRISDLFQI